jgi:hypothetical protein
VGDNLFHRQRADTANGKSEMRNLIEIPPLEPHCGSWVVSRKTGEAIGEFYERANVEKFNPATCVVETAAQYLGRVNSQHKTKAELLADLTRYASESWGYAV